MVYFLLPRHRETRPSLRVPFFTRLVEISGARPEAGTVVGRRGFWRSLTLLLCWILVVAALMRPQWIDGLPGYVSMERGILQTTALAVEEGRIAAIYITRNPDKLARVVEALKA